MKIKVLTLFPDMLRPVLRESILGRAIDAGHLSVEVVNIRDYAQNKHRNTDDYPFGGGAGMVMYAQPIVDAIEAVDSSHAARRVYLSPRGRTLNQRIVEEYASEAELLLLCGHYEGVDQRALDLCIDEELSIGDYVLTGGELAALVVIDSVARLVPGVLGCAESSADESFSMGLLEYPQYTRPAEFRGLRVPEVLLGGNHADILEWRREKALEATHRHRPEMLETAPLTDEDQKILKRIHAAEATSKVLTNLGIKHAQVGSKTATEFPKKWFYAFVPKENQPAAKKQCFSGRRHIGYLYQAFSMDFAPSLSGEEARAAFENVEKKNLVLYLPEDEIAFAVEGNLPPNTFGHFILTDESLTFTYAQPGKQNLGPFFTAKKEKVQ